MQMDIFGNAIADDMPIEARPIDVPTTNIFEASEPASNNASDDLSTAQAIIDRYRNSKAFQSSGLCRHLHIWAIRQSDDVMEEILTNLQIIADNKSGPHQRVVTALRNAQPRRFLDMLETEKTNRANGHSNEEVKQQC